MRRRRRLEPPGLPRAILALAAAPVVAATAVTEEAALTLTLSRQAGDGAVWSLAGTLTL